MRTPQTLFLLGYLPNLIGVFFNSVELLDNTWPEADETLAERLVELEAELSEQQADTVTNVRRLAAQLSEIGVPAVAPPETPDKYPDFRAAVCDQVSAVVEPGSHEDVAFLLGWVVGDACLTLNLLSISYHFLAIQPEHPFLQTQLEPLKEDLAELLPRLAALSEHPALSAAVQLEARLAQAVLQSVVERPELELTTDPDPWAEEAQASTQLLRALAAQTQQMESAFIQV